MSLPKISVWSLFRDDAGDNLRNYQERIYSLDYPPDLLKFYLVEGDSVDDTWLELGQWATSDKRVSVVKCTTGKARMSHTPHPDRIATLAQVGNAALRILANDRFGELACLIESDLLYAPDTLRQLVSHRPDGAVISPFVWIPAPHGYQFYDVWAFRTLDGELFQASRPEWFAIHMPDSSFEVQSVGSFVLLPADPIYDGVRYTDTEAIRGICHQYAARGYPIYADPTVNIFHPIVINPYAQFKPNQKQMKVNESGGKWVS